MSNSVSDPVVVRVALTGHRDLTSANGPENRRLVGEALASIVGSSAPARVELLTGLADGADLLATEVAQSMGIDIHVVLPKPLDAYRTELSEAAAATLDALAADPDVPLTVIGPAEPAADEDESAPYLRLGLYLAEAAHVLIAFWDGSFERKPGGTLDVLARFLDHAYDPDGDTSSEPIIEDSKAAGALGGSSAVWIESSRGEIADPPQPRMHYLTSSGSPGMWLRSDETPGGLEQMLHDAAAAAALAIDKADAIGSGYPLLDELPEDLDPVEVAALDEIHSAYLQADQLAILEQTRSDRSFILVAWIAAAMGFAFLWFAKISAENIWLYVYLLLFLSGYLLFRWARSANWLRHHLSMRILAETLRVRYFATLLGVANQIDVRRLLSLTGVASFPGLAWAVEADRVGVPTTGVPPDPQVAQIQLVRSDWVDDQTAYFKTKVERLEVRHERLEVITRVLYVLSALTVVVLIFWSTQLKKEYLWDDVSAKTFVVFLMGLLPLWLTIWELHQGRMATRELLWQFRNQSEIFSHASLQLRWLRDPDAQIRVFVELAERSLFEAYLWTIHRFHREFEPPSGG